METDQTILVTLKNCQKSRPVPSLVTLMALTLTADLQGMEVNSLWGQKHVWVQAHPNHQ